MPEQVTVFSAPGRLVPREENPRKYYPAKQGEAVEIARTPYVERLLLTGDLLDAAAAAKPSGKKKE